jgi:hypothetical protein
LLVVWSGTWHWSFGDSDKGLLFCSFIY